MVSALGMFVDLRLPVWSLVMSCLLASVGQYLVSFSVKLLRSVINQQLLIILDLKSGKVAANTFSDSAPNSAEIENDGSK